MSACPPSLVTELQLTRKKWPRAKRVEFGNGTIAYSEWYIYLGPFLGNTAVIDSMISVIASVSSANLHGFSVTMGVDLIARIHSRSGVEVCQATLRHTDHLYYGNLYEMMGIAASREGEATVVHYDKDSHYDGDSGGSGTVIPNGEYCPLPATQTKD